MSEPGFLRASVGFQRYRGRLPWANRASFYLAISRGEIPSVRFGTAIYIPRWVLKALASGDVEALQRSAPTQMEDPSKGLQPAGAPRA